MFTAKSRSKRGAYVKEQPFPKNLRARYSLFADSSLLCFAQSAIFTRFEGTGDLYIEIFAVDLVIASDGCQNSTWRSLISCLMRAVADAAFLSITFWRKSTTVTKTSRVLIQRSRMILPIEVDTTMLLALSHEILFPWESLQVSKKRLAPAVGQNFTGHNVWTCSSPFTCHTV